MLSQKSFGNLSTSFSEQPASKKSFQGSYFCLYSDCPKFYYFFPVFFKMSKTSVRAEYAHAVEETALGNKL